MIDPPDTSATTASKDKLARSESQDSKAEKGDSRHVEAHAIPVDTHDMYEGDDSAVDPVYQAKAHILNDAFQEIGMGRYQVCVYCPTASCDIWLTAPVAVVPLHCCGVWMVLVSGYSPAVVFTRHVD